MKILLDENIDRRIQSEFGPDYQVYTVRQMSWNGKRNGELLELVTNNGFDILIMLDKNIQFQQNLKKFKINIILLKAKNSRYNTIKYLIPKVLTALQKGIAKQITEIS